MDEHATVIIEGLLEEIKDYRKEIRVMIEELEKVRLRVDTLLPNSTQNTRVIKYFEEKVKSITELYKTILDMRKEIGKSLKDEIEIRRKMGGNDSYDIEDLLDVRSMAKKVEKFQDKLEDMKEEVKDV